MAALALVAAGCWGGLPIPAWALGPKDPFTAAPLTVPAGAAAAGAQAVGQGAEVGFAGVRTGRAPVALIDGQWWPLGATLPQRNTARLVAVDSHSVTLRHSDGRRERLTLFASAGASPPAQISARPPQAALPPEEAPATKAPPPAALPFSTTPRAPLVARSTP